MADIKYEIVKKIGVVSKSASGWANEAGVNLCATLSYPEVWFSMEVLSI
jgi:hypothetical protein